MESNKKHWNVKHGDAPGGKPTKELSIWYGMRQRCYDKNCDHYHSWGGRGIKICERWQEYKNFLADMGRCPEGYSIERIDVNGDYCPENCKWIPMRDQSKNRRDTRRLTYCGTTDTLCQWAKRLKINPGTMHYFVKRYGNDEGLRIAVSKYGYVQVAA